MRKIEDQRGNKPEEMRVLLYSDVTHAGFGFAA
jgi:hypothetical protein